MKHNTVTLECANCMTFHNVENEPGAAVDVQPCHDDNCNKKLCSSCEQFACENCGLAHCLSHGVVIEGAIWCRVCEADLDKWWNVWMQVEREDLELASPADIEQTLMFIGAGVTSAEAAHFAAFVAEGRLQ